MSPQNELGQLFKTRILLKVRSLANGTTKFRGWAAAFSRAEMKQVSFGEQGQQGANRYNSVLHRGAPPHSVSTCKAANQQQTQNSDAQSSVFVPYGT